MLAITQTMHDPNLFDKWFSGDTFGVRPTRSGLRFGQSASSVRSAEAMIPTWCCHDTGMGLTGTERR